MTRWTAARKAALLRSIATGHTTRDAEKKRHGLSDEELDEWTARYARWGLNGLKSGKVQVLRNPPERSL